jgi:carbamoyl-phosphate synthase small subunit
MKNNSVNLVLQDGTSFRGVKRGYFPQDKIMVGEVVFNTALLGYQEVITDPSYKGQIICFTYPHIGNYGINQLYSEREKAYCEGVIAKHITENPSFRASEMTLEQFLIENQIPALSGVDTRALTKHIRTFGSLKAAAGDLSKNELVELANSFPGTDNQDLVKDVTYKALRSFPSSTDTGLNVAVYDFGVKKSTIKSLCAFANVTVIPAHSSANDLLDGSLLGVVPDGILLSNGPGDPSALNYIVKEIKLLLGKVPIFGICLGHQILAQALNLKTYKLQFGHHGANHPVKRLSDGKVEITSQNHNYAVDPNGLKGDVEITHINLNDGVVEGLRSDSFRCFSVQYHPEAAPGPYDARYLFDQFKQLILDRRANAQKN